MPADLTLSPRAVALLEERRQARSIAEIAYEHAPFADGVMCYSAPGSWSNQAVGVGFDRAPTPDEFRAFLDWYTTRSVEPRLELHPFVPASFLQALAEANFTVRRFEHVLARPLDHAETCVPLFQPPGDLQLHELDPADSTTLEAITRIQAEGFLPVGHTPDESLLETIRRALRLPRARTFYATLDAPGGERLIAGCAGMESAPPVAALYGAVVLPGFRRRGVQQALIAHRLNAGISMGCRVATIGSRPDIPTERNALRMGFTVAYSKTIAAMAGPGLITSDIPDPDQSA
ncbi:MAG: GNAT family N-acetyltransferase [Phycisphaeraceae bacterium]|nr:GNAT family N-acetyltransferase [Phycisphaeraceae bacterium]MCW5753269.1 GNAT family N-acetyltransferase [Phycisphaeraceae bacterium]